MKVNWVDRTDMLPYNLLCNPHSLEFLYTLSFQGCREVSSGWSCNIQHYLYDLGKVSRRFCSSPSPQRSGSKTLLASSVLLIVGRLTLGLPVVTGVVYTMQMLFPHCWVPAGSLEIIMCNTKACLFKFSNPVLQVKKNYCDFCLYVHIVLWSAFIVFGVLWSLFFVVVALGKKFLLSSW